MTPPILSNITLATCGTNKRFMMMGKPSDVLKVLERSFIKIECAPPPFERGTRNEPKQITVHITSARSVSYSLKPFSVYREVVITLRVFNEQKDVEDASSCLCCPYSTGLTKVVPSGTSLNQLADLLRQSRCILSKSKQPAVNTKAYTDVDANSRLLSNSFHTCYVSPPAYQTVAGCRSNLDDNGRPPPSYGGCPENLPSYSPAYARRHS